MINVHIWKAMEPPPPASDYERLRRLSPKIDLLPSSVETLSPDEGVLLSSLITDGQGDVDVAAAAEIADRAEAENEVKRHYACGATANSPVLCNTAIGHARP